MPPWRNLVEAPVQTPSARFHSLMRRLNSLMVGPSFLRSARAEPPDGVGVAAGDAKVTRGEGVFEGSAEAPTNATAAMISTGTISTARTTTRTTFVPRFGGG